MEDLYFEPCVRCGYCCQKVTCLWGSTYTPDHLRGKDIQCPFLLGDRPGFYSCKLVAEGVVPPDALAIGGGCSSTLFNTQRWEAIASRRADDHRDDGTEVPIGTTLGRSS